MQTILLHAFPLDGSMWSEIDGEPVDYPGQGSLAGWADLVAERIAGAALVCGLSMGGYAAFELARRHPAKLAGLLLADTRPGADGAEQRAARDANIELVRREGAAALWRKVGPSLLRPGAEPVVVEQARAICE